MYPDIFREFTHSLKNRAHFFDTFPENIISSRPVNIAMCVCIVACNCRLLTELLSEMFSEQSNHPQVMQSVKHKNKSIEINSLAATITFQFRFKTFTFV